MLLIFNEIYLYNWYVFICNDLCNEQLICKEISNMLELII